MISVSLKECLYATAIGLSVIAISKPILLKFSSEADYRRRKNLWLTLTIALFLVSNYWMFVAIAAPAIYVGGKKDKNPVALYMFLLNVMPPAEVTIPLIGKNGLFDLNSYRLLALCILLPTAYRLSHTAGRHGSRLEAMDYLLIVSGLLQVFLFVPPDLPNHLIIHNSLTNGMRTGFVYFLDVFILFYSVSRFCSNPAALLEAMAAGCVGLATVATIAIFEFAHHWLLYTDIYAHWSCSECLFYLQRGDMIRAQVTAGHALSLGYALSVGLGFWFLIRTRVTSKYIRILYPCIFIFGLISAYSRGPWLGAFVIYIAFEVLRQRRVSAAIKALMMVTVIGGVLIVSPLGSKITTVLPFFGGTVDSGSVSYRQQVLERAWEVAAQHPLFGDQLAMTKLDDLRQGQGIIDLVNSYVEIGLFYGLAGLGAFIGFMLLALTRAIRATLATRESSQALIGASIGACIVGTALMISECSFIFDYRIYFYVLAAFATAFAKASRFANRPTGASITNI